MNNYIHLITTRFNVPTKNWFETREGKTPLTDEWHEHRFRLFLNFTLPSFKNQSNQNFKWLVFFDVNTQDKYKQIIAEIQKDYPNFIPYFINHGDEINSNIRSWTKDYFEDNTSYLITTDIDNDDVLHRDYIKTVQQHFQPIHELVIDLRRGLQISIDDLVIKSVNEYYGVANPFVSFVEDITKDYKTIMNEMHPNFRHYASISSYDEHPMFIQIIHNYNLMNNTFDTKQLTHINKEEFGFSPNVKTDISAWNATVANTNKKINTLKKLLGLKKK